MVFRSKGRKVYKIRVKDLEGQSATLSAGTSDLETAKAVAAMVSRFKSQRKRKVLSALTNKKVPLARVFDAYEEGEDALDRLLEHLTAADLSSLVDEWAKHATPKYVTQVRSFIPEGKPFPVSRFRRGEISQFLASLEVSGSTKNRYKAALSVFARWLVEREVLEVADESPEADPMDRDTLELARGNLEEMRSLFRGKQSFGHRFFQG